MLETSSAFKAAMLSGNFTRVDYAFLFRAGQNQTYANADGRWAEVDYGHPPLFAGVTFPAQAAITEWAPPNERVLGGRDLGQIRIADPDLTWRRYFDRNYWVGHRIEVIWDYRWGDGQHQIVHYYEGITGGGDYDEDEQGRRVLLNLTGPFSKLDPNLQANLTPAQQKGRRDPGDTSMDDLQDAWDVRIGRKPGR